MVTQEATAKRTETREEKLKAWAAEHAIVLRRLDEGQRWVVFAALQAAGVIGEIPALRRLLAYVLAHCGMGISGPVIAALTGVTDRAIRATKTLSPEELLHSVRTPPRGRGRPKLGPEHAGEVARFLVDHPRAPVKHIISHVHKTLGVELDRKTLRMYLQRYGLGCLRGDTHADSPLF